MFWKIYCGLELSNFLDNLSDTPGKKDKKKKNKWMIINQSVFVYLPVFYEKQNAENYSKDFGIISGIVSVTNQS